MKADRLFGLLEYQRLRGYITNEACDKEFARVDRLLKGVQRTALRLATGLRRRLNSKPDRDDEGASPTHVADDNAVGGVADAADMITADK